MIDSQDRSLLKSIVENYKQIQENLTKAEKLQESIKKQIEDDLKLLEETKVKEEKTMKKIEKKYGRKFTPTELFEIVYNND